jgi:HD-like signal output (HDOD) protein
MAILQQLFKGKRTDSITAMAEADISLEILKQLIPIRTLSEEKLESFILNNKAQLFAAGATLFTAGKASNSIFFLIKGTVTLKDDKGSSYEVVAESPQAKFPLTSGAVYTTTAVAKTKVAIIQVAQKIMTMGIGEQEKQKRLEIPDELSENKLVQAFSQHYLEDELEIPSMPSVAVKLRKAMRRNIGIAEAVEIIQLDPVMSAKLVQVANCPLYISVNPAKSCFEAVNRIGLYATRNLIISLSVKQIFKSNNKLIAAYLDKIWRQSIFVSGIAYTLATITKQIDPEEALLAGLISDIGLVPFLNFAANLPADYFEKQDLDLIIPYIRGPIGSNVLLKWDFPDEFVAIPSLAEDWHQSHGDKLTLADIVVLSRLHSKIGKSEMAALPAITSIPAASKLEDTALSPENSLQILHDAKHKIKEALKVFSI